MRGRSEGGPEHCRPVGVSPTAAGSCPHGLHVRLPGLSRDRVTPVVCFLTGVPKGWETDYTPEGAVYFIR